MHSRSADAATNDASADQTLVARVRAGDRQAFNAIVLAHAAELLAFAYRKSGSRAVAEDLVQDVFFQIWKSHDTWRVPGSISWYLFRAVQNRAYNVFARERVARRWRERHAVAGESTTPTADSHVERAEAEASCARVLSTLPESVQAVVHLRVSEDLTHPEIAKRLGISIKTVERRMAQARHLLRDVLARAGLIDP
jgi:RNA polymerase sigma-70 factor (ECF subfamily)